MHSCRLLLKYFHNLFLDLYFHHLCTSRKYVKRQEHLKKALSWWEDEEENPTIGYLDFSKRKLLFNFGSYRRGSDTSCRLAENCDVIGFALYWLIFSILCAFRINFAEEKLSKADPRSLPSHFLRRWKKASAMLNVALVMTKIPTRER